MQAQVGFRCVGRGTTASGIRYSIVQLPSGSRVRAIDWESFRQRHLDVPPRMIVDPKPDRRRKAA